MTILVVSGMPAERDVAKTIPGAVAILVSDLSRIDVTEEIAGIARFGVSGGLSPALKRGDVILASSLVTPNGSHIVGNAWGNRVATLVGITMHHGKLFSQPNVWITDPARRKQFHDRTGADFSDNESAAVYDWAGAHNVPAIFIGAISDESDDTVINNQAEVNADGSPNLLVDIRDFVHHPDMMTKEGIGFEEALEGLRHLVTVLGDQLGFVS